MRPWIELDRSPIPGNKDPLVLSQRGEEFIIRIGNIDLMTSRMSSSEEALASMAAYRCAKDRPLHVLVGGLGMGFTTASALQAFPAGSQILTAELLPKVVEWNEQFYGHLAGYPLKDPRSTVHIGDVDTVIRENPGQFDAILLDVDNGPDDFTMADNQSLYDGRGLRAAKRALRPNGVLAIWSAFDDPRFTRLLQAQGFEVELKGVRAHKGRGQQHYIWFAIHREAEANPSSAPSEA